MSDTAASYGAVGTEPALFRAQRLARELLAETRATPIEINAFVDAIIAATVEVAVACSERRLVAIEARQPGEERHTLALMAATLGSAFFAGTAAESVAQARVILAAVEDALGIVRLTEPANDEAPR